MAERTSLAHSSSANKKRPPILKRTSISTQSTSSGALLGSPRRERVRLETTEDTAEIMAASFLQYCAMCEKQITTPGNSILYCSEACRRKDSNKPLSAANIMSTSTSPPSTPSSPRSILQPRTPTGVTPNTDIPVVRIPPENHGFKSDLDPTEWKPKLRRGTRPASNRYNSEAFRYLSSFHRAINKNNDIDGIPNEIKIDVPHMDCVSATAPTTPRLGNTPTTTASSSWSLSTSAGFDGAGMSNGGYVFSARPLMPRHNRWYSTSVIGGGVDLVTPHIPPPPDNGYAKKDVILDANRSTSGLGAFFGGE